MSPIDVIAAVTIMPMLISALFGAFMLGRFYQLQRLQVRGVIEEARRERAVAEASPEARRIVDDIATAAGVVARST